MHNKGRAFRSHPASLFGMSCARVERHDTIVQFSRPMSRSSQKVKRRPARPRIPLPRQTGGVHEDKTKRPWRRRKHRKVEEP